MALLGKAAVAMWWDMDPAVRPEFEDWHTHEHFPERLGIPGFLRSSRWQSATGTEGFFVMYELQDYETLVSPAYLERLNHPTPWSSKMMPHHRNMVRSQTVVLESRGGAIARSILTLRLSPAAGAEQKLRDHLHTLFPGVAASRGISAAHLLETRTPAIAATAEQKMRGGPDAAADWIVLVCGYETGALESLRQSSLSDTSLAARGAAPSLVSGLYNLNHTLVGADID